MLMLPSDLREKLVTAVIVVGAAATVASAIYIYERHYRGPTDKVLVGAWDAALFPDEPVHYRIDADHTFRILGEPEDEQSVWERGTWYAGGDFIYFGRSWRQVEEHGGVALEIWKIDHISPAEMQLTNNQMWGHVTFKRVDTNASNQAMQPTASPRTASPSDD